MASTVLYPPIVENSYPAFIANEEATCRIYFSLSKFNAGSDIKAAHIAIYKQSNGLNVVNKKLNNSNEDGKYRATGIILNTPIIQMANEENLYYVEVKNEDIIDGWQVGWIYKIQLRLSEELYDESITQSAWVNAFANKFSEWSTVAYVKATGEVFFQIPNYSYDGKEDVHETSIENLDFVGSYRNTDTSENLYSYRVQLYDNSMTLLEDSGNLYTNQYASINQISYSFKTEPQNNTNYIVKLTYETSNKYSNFITFTCAVVQSELSATSIKLLTAENDINNIMKSISTIFEEEEEGRVGLKLYSESASETLDIMIRRADSRDNFQTWTDIKNISLSNDDVNSLPIVYDYTIESGVWYKYGIQKYEKTTNSVSRGPLNIITNPVMRNINYTFLLGRNNQQLKLQFNNNLNNYRINLNEGIVTTLGGKYPFIVRNGATNYKTFTITGLISFNMDENGLFITRDKIYKFEEIANLYKQYNEDNGISHYDYIYEKEFRDAVVQFLHDGKPKLFKSATEGNLLVRLTDISLSPQQSLSRIVYEFSATVNEIAEASMQNYKKYELYSL